VQKSAGKVLASIFWDQGCNLLIDYLPTGQTINVKYYSSLLVQLKDILKEKCHEKVTRRVESLTQRPNFCEILAFHSGEVEDSGLPRCDIVSLG